MADEHARELDEVAADELLGDREEVHLVGVAADGQQFLVDAGHPVEQRRAGQEPEAQLVGRDDLVGPGLEQVVAVVRVAALDGDVGLAVAAADVADRDAGQDRLAVGVLALAVVGQDHDRVGPGHPGPAEDDLVGRVALDDVDVVEGRVVLLVGQVDLLGVVVDDDDRPLVLDDLGVDLADPVQAARAPVAEDQVVLHLEVRHVAPPQLLFDQDRGHGRREQARQADPGAEQDHRDQPARSSSSAASSRPLKSRTQTLQNDSAQVSKAGLPPRSARWIPIAPSSQATRIAADDPDDLVAVPMAQDRHDRLPVLARGDPSDRGPPSRSPWFGHGAAVSRGSGRARRLRLTTDGRLTTVGRRPGPVIAGRHDQFDRRRSGFSGCRLGLSYDVNGRAIASTQDSA